MTTLTTHLHNAEISFKDRHYKESSNSVELINKRYYFYRDLAVKAGLKIIDLQVDVYYYSLLKHLVVDISGEQRGKIEEVADTLMLIVLAAYDYGFRVVPESLPFCVHRGKKDVCDQLGELKIKKDGIININSSVAILTPKLYRNMINPN